MKKYFGLLALIFSLNANATLIDNGDYITDTNSGLDWLKLDSTYGKSYDQVSGEISSGGQLEGWQYATAIEWEHMLFGQGATPKYSCSNGTNFCGFVDGISDTEMLDLITLFGDAQSSPNQYYPYPTSVGFLADINPATNDHQTAMFIYDGAKPYDVVLMANTVASSYLQTTGINGSWLVRATAVPEPSSLALMILGLGAFSLRKKKKA